jgi:F-type H+-transporting ATPase subunit epsilon
MPKTFHADILTSEKTIFKGEVVSLVVPAELGYLGVWANHAPLIARLKSGNIILKDALGRQETFSFKGRGFLEVCKNQALIILDPRPA